MQKLPIGIQTFRDIIENNLLYVDKTKEINELINSGKYFFISRPRRFGKSLLLSTIKEIFNGNKELFRGLYIENKYTWEKHPVIHISMSNLKGTNDINSINQSTLLMLNNSAKENDIVLEKFDNPAMMFGELIIKLSKINKVVILIDEYDKPILDNINNLDIAKQNRVFLRDFYSVLKDNDQYIKFCLLIGISKFSKVSVFSGLNNLKDITLSEKFSTICGLTQKEVDDYFDDRIPWISKKLKLTKEELKEKIRLWYNGYSWDGVNKVYNPFSILNFFEDGQFNNYWFSTGTPTFLIEKFKESKTIIEDVSEFETGGLFFDSFDIETIDFRALLFQTGYLTIKNFDEVSNIYTIGYPNKEVKDAFLAYITTTFTEKSAGDIDYISKALRISLMKEDYSKFFMLLKSLFISIPYQIHIPAEAYYHSLFYLIMELVGINFLAERSTSKGRIDGVVEFDDKIYIIEFKYLPEDKEVEKVLESAIEQIKEKEYYLPYIKKNKVIKYLAVAINREVVEYNLLEN